MHQIRREYQHVSDKVYPVERAKVLRRFLSLAEQQYRAHPSEAETKSVSSSSSSSSTATTAPSGALSSLLASELNARLYRTDVGIKRFLSRAIFNLNHEINALDAQAAALSS